MCSDAIEGKHHVSDYTRAQALCESGRCKEALSFYLSLAERPEAAGDLFAFIGKMYRDGMGTAPDKQEALRWYERAANAGDPAAIVYLAQLDLAAGRLEGAIKGLMRAEEHES